ncbi:hypothetical protein [Dickeya fangzhongdai]|uniref:hypothetical protein n=1 Tax=Dickeya fangzhongdai TaxID=1778540 RepID=UPI0026E06729|nr:hypothetical protein [Dickeya fangzhongdai]WKV49387.1 hypothetical protein PL145_15690 [Dickeya fangzhongdai]
MGRHIPEFIFLPSVLRDRIDRLMLSGRPILLSGEPGADLSEITGYIRARLQALQGRYVELSGEGNPTQRLEEALAAIPDDRRLTLCIPGFDTLTEQQQQKALALLQVEHARRSELRLVFGLIAAPAEHVRVAGAARSTTGVGIWLSVAVGTGPERQNAGYRRTGSCRLAGVPSVSPADIAS